MLLELVILLAGLAVLAKSSDFTITNAVKFSKASGINQIVVGFILIAVATSLPEMTIAVMSSVGGNGQLSLGNLIGADIINMTLIFAVMSFIGFSIKKKELDEMALACIIVSVTALFLFITGVANFIFGIFLLILFYTFARILLDKKVTVDHHHIDKKKSRKYAFLSLGGIAIVILSASIVTEYALMIASELVLSETLIGATIVSFGTTLPELSVNIAALRKKNFGLAIGDSMGTIVSNITLVLGMAAIINPITVDAVASGSLLFLLFASALIVYMTSRLKFGRREGVLFFMAYMFYIAMIIGV
jgi:cation:H+ antiporter